MSRYTTDVTPTLSSIVADLDKRLKAIESGNRIGYTSVDSGSFTVSASLALDFVGNHVDTLETLSNGSYGDLVTPGPTVGTVISGSGMALVIVSCMVDFDVQDADTNMGWMSFLVNGPTTILPDDTRAAGISLSQPITAEDLSVSTGVSNAYMLTTLSPGSYSFAAKYRGGTGLSGNVAFSGRSIAVLPF